MQFNELSISLGSFIRQAPADAIRRSLAGIEVPVLGKIGLSIIQLCPQNLAFINEDLLDSLMEDFPGIEIRFHANVQVQPQKVILDVIDFDPSLEYWKNMKSLMQHAKCRSYSAHAGYRAKGSMSDLMEKHKALSDFLEIPVAVEGHYPARQNQFLASTWREWEMIFNSGLPYVVDLSHAAIIARRSYQNTQLLEAMMKSPMCLEVHISGNNEIADQHTPLTGSEWWLPLLDHRQAQAHVFYEGVFRI